MNIYTSYRDMEDAIRCLRDFRGNSAHATLDSDGVYTVYSYNTPIAKANVRTGGVVLNSRKYSTTTSRLQNIVRRAWSDLTISELA